MPVTKEEIVIGLTKWCSTNISAPYGEEEIQAMGHMAEDFNNNTFEKNIALWEDLCQNELAKALLPPWGTSVRVRADGTWTTDLPENGVWGLQPGEEIASGWFVAARHHTVASPVWFALEILDAIDVVRRAIARQDATEAARAALYLGELKTFAKLKFAWESLALYGKARKESLHTGNIKSKKTRGDQKEKNQGYARNYADQIWESNPDIPIMKIAYCLRQKKGGEFYGAPINTIRGYLKKPEEWSTFYKPRKKNLTN
jgi:hypothetical protein